MYVVKVRRLISRGEHYTSACSDQEKPPRMMDMLTDILE
jgi:hypothetical protein